MTNVPTETDKTWSITKSSTSITVMYNGAEVVKVNTEKFPECAKVLSQKVKQIQFSYSDTATVMYRRAPPPGDI